MKYYMFPNNVFRFREKGRYAVEGVDGERVEVDAGFAQLLQHHGDGQAPVTEVILAVDGPALPLEVPRPPPQISRHQGPPAFIKRAGWDAALEIVIGIPLAPDVVFESLEGLLMGLE